MEEVFASCVCVCVCVLRPQKLQGLASPRILGSVTTSPFCKCIAT